MHEDVSIHCLTVTKAFPVLQNLFKTALTKLPVSQWQAEALLADSSFVNLVRASRNNSLLWSLSNRQKAMGEFKFTSREQDNSAPRVEGTSPVPGTFLWQALRAPALASVLTPVELCSGLEQLTDRNENIFFHPLTGQQIVRITTRARLSVTAQCEISFSWWGAYTAGAELQDASRRCSKVGSALPAQQPTKSTGVSTR